MIQSMVMVVFPLCFDINPFSCPRCYIQAINGTGGATGGGTGGAECLLLVSGGRRFEGGAQRKQGPGLGPGAEGGGERARVVVVVVVHVVAEGGDVSAAVV